MNSGVAKEVRQRYPHVYKRLCAPLRIFIRIIPKKLLGTMQLIHMDENETHSKYLPYQAGTLQIYTPRIAMVMMAHSTRI